MAISSWPAFSKRCDFCFSFSCFTRNLQREPCLSDWELCCIDYIYTANDILHSGNSPAICVNFLNTTWAWQLISSHPSISSISLLHIIVRNIKNWMFSPYCYSYSRGTFKAPLGQCTVMSVQATIQINCQGRRREANNICPWFILNNDRQKTILWIVIWVCQWWNPGWAKGQREAEC